MAHTYTALIVDDEALARSNVRQLLTVHPDIRIIDECEDGISAITAIQAHQPDLLFLDIQMPEVNGFDVLKAVTGIAQPYVVFATAYDEYAIQAFEVNALDYLLKPFTEERFAEAVQKARTRLQQDSMGQMQSRLDALLASLPAQAPQQYLHKIAIRGTGKIYFVPVADVIWIEANDQYVFVHTTNDKHLLRNSLNQLAQQLDPHLFYRSHRSSIVSIEAIAEISPYFKGDYMMVLNNGVTVKLARTRVAALRKMLGW
ncbi:MAG: LytTR family DNA-binding domain-containing protein [Bacteroidota bacterium]